MLKRFLNTSNNIPRDSFVWNMTGSMLNAFQSVILLMILTRITSLTEAGIFTIAYANANLFMFIGKYGMRNFQVSDVNRQFTFKEYNYSRFITTFIMMAAAIIYVICAGKANNYSQNKSLCIIWMCLFKMVDSLEDTYLGLYQQENRLDVAGKCMTVRMSTMIIIFSISLIVTKALLPALIISTITTAIICVILIWLTFPSYRQPNETASMKNIIFLLQKCFPLFLGTFLSFYIGNAPKYAIDSLLSDELQACYGFIAMPVFVIGLLNNFIFNPLIARMSLMWNDKEYKGFKKLFMQQLLVVVAITVVCEIGAFLLGIPVLSIMYNTDLTNYKSELLVLLLGGGFLALSGLFVTIITIMRKQNFLAIGYTIVSVFALVLSSVFVRRYEMMGAAGLYVALMVGLCVIFGVPLVMELNKATKSVSK